MARSLGPELFRSVQVPEYPASFEEAFEANMHFRNFKTSVADFLNMHGEVVDETYDGKGETYVFQPTSQHMRKARRTVTLSKGPAMVLAAPVVDPWREQGGGWNEEDSCWLVTFHYGDTDPDKFTSGDGEILLKTFNAMASGRIASGPNLLQRLTSPKFVADAASGKDEKAFAALVGALAAIEKGGRAIGATDESTIQTAGRYARILSGKEKAELKEDDFKKMSQLVYGFLKGPSR